MEMNLFQITTYSFFVCCLNSYMETWGALGSFVIVRGEMMKVLSSPGLSALSWLTCLKPRMRIQFIFLSSYEYYLSLFLY